MQHEAGKEARAVTEHQLDQVSPASEPDGEPKEEAFDWQECWYPISFLQDFPRDRPVGFTLYDNPLVLFFDGQGQVVCLRDRCAHRAARLSDGQLMNGRLECLYHGWQFGAGGRCLHIPQLPAGMEMPERCSVPSHPTAIQGDIVWVWPGRPERADRGLIPVAPDVVGPSVFSVTFQMDLPYDQGYLIENVIDVAHIHIAHDGVRGGGLREAARPLEFQLEDRSIAGFRSSFRSMGLVRGEDSPDLTGAMVEFVAPNLVRYTSKYRDPKLVAGLELYSLPLGRNRCRILYRKYSSFTSLWERLKPRWMEHLIQCTILEQDMAVVIGQSEEIARSGARLRDVWLPIKSSDRLVIEYRKWLDRFGHGLPQYRGFATSKESPSDACAARLPADRHVLHTRQCLTCGRLHHRLGMAINLLWILVVVASGMALFVNGGWSKAVLMLLTLGSLLAVMTAQRLRSRM